MKISTPVLFLLLILLCEKIFPINYVWTGTSNNLWSNTANWAPAGVPGGVDNVTINAGTPFSPFLPGNVTVTNITVNTGATLDVGLSGFTSVGTAFYNNCTLTGNGGFIKCSGGSNTILNVTCSVIFNLNGNWTITGSTFNGPVSLTKSGGAVTQTSGGNTYNNTLNIANNSSGAFRFGVTNPDTYNSTIYAENTFNNATISFAYNSANNIFNGTISIAASSGVGFLNFGIAGGSGTLSPGVTIQEGGPGFLGGTCEIRNMTQLGTAITHVLDLSIPVCCSSTALILKLGPGNTFNGPVNFTASNILLNGGVYNGVTSYFTKAVNGSAVSNVSDGGNIFNSPNTYIANLTSSALTLANINPDDFNGNAHFQKGISASNILVAHNGINTFAGNITVTGSAFAGVPPVQFGYGNGTVRLDGNGNQNIIRINPGTVGPPSITRLEVNKPSGAVFLNTSIDVLDTLSLVNGLIYSSAGNYVIMNNGSETSIGNAGSYINGPMIYRLGNTSPTVLNFPVGKAGFHRPAFLNVVHTNTTITSYTTELIHSSAMALGYTLPPTISHVSLVRYWDINRESQANLDSASATLFYGADDGVTTPASLRVAKTIGTGTAWFDVGGVGSAPITGSIASSYFTTFSKFALANDLSGMNPLPIALLEFTATAETERVKLLWKTANEKRNASFTLERSRDAIQFEEIAREKGSGNSNQVKEYIKYDNEPASGLSYYRLKQTDEDGAVSYSAPQLVNFNLQPTKAFIFPNPTDNELHLSYYSDSERILAIRMIDMCGQIVWTEEFRVNSGNNLVHISASSLAQGVYQMELITENKTNLKFIKE
jgi:hypothetical protein